MPDETNKELLKEILRQQQDNAKTLTENAFIQHQFSESVSNFMNDQSLHNNRIKSLLETDPTTQKLGVVEDLNILKYNFNSYKESLNKKIAFMSGGVVVLYTLGKWVVTKIFV